MASNTPYLPLYRALVDNAHDLLGVVDLQGQIRYLNPAARQIDPRFYRQGTDKPLSAFCHPEDHPTLESWLRRLRRLDTRELCNLRMGADKQWRSLELSGVRIQEDESNEVIVLSAHDETEQRAASRLLSASEKRYHGAFDYSPIGKALVASDGLVVEANRALAEMLGCWVSELLGSNLFDYFNDEDALSLRSDTAALMIRQQEQTERELKRASMPPRWLQLNIAPIWADDGKLEHLIVQAQDVTARRQAEHNLRETNADLLRSNEELKRFAFVASHDLREPLRGIGGSIQLIQRRYKDALAEDGAELAQTAVAGVRKLQSLLDDLVAYADQMRGGELKRETVNCSMLVSQWIQQHGAELQAVSASLEHSDLPSLLADSEQLAQLFALLLDNALKFVRPGATPTLKFSARWAQGVWEFCLSDNGLGIAKANQEQVFEAFRRLNPDMPGTGMGLATARKIVERHGGRIWLESEEGVGTRVYFQLPPE